MKKFTPFGFLLLLNWVFTVSCGNEGPPKEVPADTSKGLIDLSALKPSPPPKPDPVELCQTQIDAVSDIKRESLIPYRKALPRILIGARVYPVLYLQKPSVSPDESAARIRRGIPDSYRAARAIRKIVQQYRNDKPLLRKIFLQDGYLFSDQPQVAKALVSTLLIKDLFDEERIFAHLGNRIIQLERHGEEYLDEQGQRMSLVLNRRLSSVAETLNSSLHLDLQAIQDLSGARRIIPIAIGKNQAGVRLTYPNGLQTQALVVQEGLQTRIACYAAKEQTIQRARRDASEFWQWVEDLTRAASAMVLERPGFDEPEDEPEDEQEDGKLRLEWSKAYHRWKKTFFHRDVEYDVFDRRGNPVPPQVCIDFIFDTWQRASGTWYRKRGKPPGKTSGYLDFEEMPGLPRRHTSSLLSFANSSESVFDRVDFARKQQIPFRRERRFAEAIETHADQIREGDMLVIHGLREEDMENHFHTVLVLDVDPLTGIPTTVADNAGHPRIRSLASAMRSAPRRSIKHRLRIDWDWLNSQRRAFLELSNWQNNASNGGNGEDSSLPENQKSL